MIIDDLIKGLTALRKLHGGQTRIVASIPNAGPEFQLMKASIDLLASPLQVTTVEGDKKVLVIVATKYED